MADGITVLLRFAHFELADVHRQASCIVVRHLEIVLSQRVFTFISKEHRVKAGVRWCMVVYGGVWRCTQQRGGLSLWPGAVLVVYDCMQCCDTMADDYMHICACVRWCEVA